METEFIENNQYEELNSYYSNLFEDQKDITKVVKNLIKFDNLLENKKDKIITSVYDEFKNDLFDLLQECLSEIYNGLEYSKENYSIETYFTIFENISDLTYHYQQDAFKNIPDQLNENIHNLDRNIMMLYPSFDLNLFSNSEEVIFIDYFKNSEINLQ